MPYASWRPTSWANTAPLREAQHPLKTGPHPNPGTARLALAREAQFLEAQRGHQQRAQPPRPGATCDQLQWVDLDTLIAYFPGHQLLRAHT